MNDNRRVANCSACGARIPKNERQIESGDTYDLLKKWRQTKFAEKEVPPYVVASNRTLREMSIILPQSKEEMLSIHGVGEKRFDDYNFNEALDKIKGRQQEDFSFIEVCEDCVSQASGSPPPANPQISTFEGGNNCPTCGKPGWDGVHRSHTTPVMQNQPLPKSEHFQIHAIENSDISDDRITIANGNRVLDVEIRGVTLEILSRSLDNYFQKSSVGKVFDSDDYSTSFKYTPEWVSRPLEPMRGINVPGFWRCRFSHTIPNKGECHQCGDEIKNPSHYLCYPCWKSQN